MFRLAALVAIAILPINAVAAAPTATNTGEYQAAVDAAIERGRLLYAYDQAGWHGTDDAVPKLTAAGRIEELRRDGGAWIVEGDRTVPRLTFFAGWKAPRALYVADFTDGGRRLASSRVLSAEEGELTSTQRRMVAALSTAHEAAAAQKLTFCNRAKPNSVVVSPATEDGDTIVYLLTAQTQQRAWPLGGHFAIPVAADGKAKDARAFMKTCMDMAPQVSQTHTAAFFVVTHLLDPTPTELHVFTALASGMPLIVLTTPNGTAWQVLPTVKGPCITNLGPIEKLGKGGANGVRP